jgi:hypothetical protein
MINKIENGSYMIKKQVMDYIAKTFGPLTRGSLGYRVSYIPEYSEDGHVKVEHLRATFKNLGMSEMDFREMECEVTTHIVC